MEERQEAEGVVKRGREDEKGKEQQDCCVQSGGGVRAEGISSTGSARLLGGGSGGVQWAKSPTSLN